MWEKIKSLKLYQKILAAIFGAVAIGSGFYSLQSTDNYEYYNAVQTDHNTSTTVQTVTLPAVTSTVQIVTDVVANGTTSTLGASWHCVSTFKRSSSTVDTVTQIGSSVCDTNRSDTAWNMGLSTTTGAVLIKIDGAVSNTINWVIQTDRIIAQ
jgi:hypothetical protein